MFNFAYPTYLYLLALIPAIVLLYFWERHSRRRKLKKFGNPETIRHLMPDASVYKRGIKILLEVIAVAALVVALCRPRSGEKEEVSEVNGIEVMIAFDVSNSMLASANDDPNGISRLERAKLILDKLLDKLANDKVGLIVFAGEAYMQLPLTSDFLAAKQYIGELSTGMVPSQGTAIANAISMAMNSFSDNNEVRKAIIIITDAEDHQGDAVEMAKNAREQGIQINVIGLGTPKGAPIPLNRSKGEYLKDSSGQPVTTALNEQMAKEIADAGDGRYVLGAAQSALNDIARQLDTLEKSQLEHVEYKASAEQFPVFAWIALIFLVVDIFVLDRKIGWLKNINLFSERR